MGVPFCSAKEVAPMAVSLAFGILFASVITMFLVPCLYLIYVDCKALVNDRRWDASLADS